MTNLGSWADPKRVETLRSLVAEGLSCAQIALRVGLTRNAVLGKVKRLGLTTNGGDGGRPAKSRRASNNPFGAESIYDVKARIRRTVTAPVLPRHLRAAPLVSEPIPLMALGPCQCKWPTNNGEDPTHGWLFCGQPRQSGKVYCLPHALIAYTPTALKISA